jgi:hypothetical protein
MVSVAGSAIENLCGRFRHRKCSQNVVGRTHTQIVAVAKLPPTLDFKSGMDIICGYASEPPANSTQSLNSILSNQSQNADTNNTLCSLDLWI